MKLLKITARFRPAICISTNKNRRDFHLDVLLFQWEKNIMLLTQLIVIR